MQVPPMSKILFLSGDTDPPGLTDSGTNSQKGLQIQRNHGNIPPLQRSKRIILR
jgi:hypothetical protein